MFVYGTLQSNADHPTGRQLRSNARLVGTARIRGDLYLVESFTGPGGTERPSYYPACALSNGSDNMVHGELYELLDRGVLGTLDAYEECGPGFPEPQEYVREPADVEVDDGQTVQAWVYLYNRPVGGLRRIDGGRWPAVEQV